MQRESIIEKSYLVLDKRCHDVLKIHTRQQVQILMNCTYHNSYTKKLMHMNIQNVKKI
jgi:hypothetical protein